MQRRLAAGAIERTAQHLPVDRDNTLALPGKLRHEALKRYLELLRIQPAKQPAEGVMAGQAIGKLEETPQEGLLRPGIQPMSTAPCPPLSTLHSAITSNSMKSCSAAFPVRGSSNSSQHAANSSNPTSRSVALYTHR